MRRFGNFRFIFLAVFVLQGCVLAPAIQDIRSTGLTSSARKEALSSNLRNFHQALFWGNLGQALAFATPESLPTIRRELRSLHKRGRIVDSKVEFVDFSNDAKKAEVEVTFKLHDYDTNVVTPLTSYEKWTFTFSHGWKISSFQKSNHKQDLKG